MTKNFLQKIPPTHFTENGWLKAPAYIYINFIFLSKGLIISFFSLISMKKGNDIINAFYTDVTDLYIDIGVSIIPVITLILLINPQLKLNLKIKKGFFIISGLIAFYTLMVNGYLAYISKDFITSVFFQLLIIHILIIWFSIDSLITRLFIKQLFDEQPYLSNSNTEK